MSSNLVLLLGASGYVGQAFAAELRRRGCDCLPLARRTLDYTQFHLLFDYVRQLKPAFLINAAGFTGRPNVDACEIERGATLYANTILPQTIARVCLMRNIPWGHVSSGSIFNGAKVLEDGKLVAERDLNHPDLRRLLAAHPERLHGFTEADEPNFSFLSPPCNFYSGSKALAEQAIKDVGQCYIWRPGLVFSQQDHPRNFLSKLQRYSKIYDHVVSLSHLDEFARACLDLWETRAPHGIYHVANPGAVATSQVVNLLPAGRSERTYEFWKDDQDFYRFGAKAPRASFILDSSKLSVAGIKMRPALEALEDALAHWRCASPAFELLEPASAA